MSGSSVTIGPVLITNNCKCRIFLLKFAKIKRNHALCSTHIRIYVHANIKYAICAQKPNAKRFYYAINTLDSLS